MREFRTIELREALSLRKIADSGQCFRPGEIGDGVFRFISGSEVLELRQCGDRAVEVSCDAETWERVWIPYFDLARDYSAIQQGIFESGDALLAEATVHGDGIRVLRQEPFEMLVSFVLSQRKSIPAIRTAVRELAEETDYVADTWNTLAEFYASPGFTTEGARIFLAQDLSLLPEDRRTVREDEEAEFVPTWVRLDEALDAVMGGRLHNPSTVLGVLATAQARTRGWSGLRPADAPWLRSPESL